MADPGHLSTGNVSIMSRLNELRAGKSRADLRCKLRSLRQGIPGETRVRWDQAIQQLFLQLVKTRNATSIACYFPFNGEPDITPACKQLLASGHRLALPVVSEKGKSTMSFHVWQAGTELAKNKYGIPEPRDSGPVPLTGVDMLIMPLVAYDRQGNRLGMGAGYYDRHLELLLESQKPLRVGIAYSLQEINLIETNSWDIPMHGVINEQGWFSFV